MKPRASILLPQDLVDAWQDTVTHLAKLPRGTDKRDLSSHELLYKIMRSEMGGIHELWETFTQERDLLSKHLLASKQQMVRYLLGFHLPNAARMQLALTRIDERWPLHRLFHGSRPDHRRIRWNDLGCGSGAAAQAAIHFALNTGLTTDRLEMHLTDASGVLLDTAREMLTATMATFNKELDLQTHRLPLEKLKIEALGHGGDPDIVSVYTLAYVWNELERNKQAQARLKEIFLRHQRKNEAALVIILDPATQIFTRGVMELREEMVQGGYLPLYPCQLVKGQAAPCPMLERVRDWCYSEGQWTRPLFIQRLDKELGVDRSQLSVSIYALGTPELMKMLGSAPIRPPRVVVGRPERRTITPSGRRPRPVQAPRKQKDKSAPFDYLLCDGAALTKEPGEVPPEEPKAKIASPKAKKAGKKISLRGELFRL